MFLRSEIVMSGFTDKSELVENEGEVPQERVEEPGEDEMRSHVIDAGNNTSNLRKKHAFLLNLRFNNKALFSFVIF